MDQYFEIAFSAESDRHQRRRGSYAAYQHERNETGPEGLGADEHEFLEEGDSLYLASVGPGGWPYVQHRGGPSGFVHVLDPTRLAWVERPGNRQYVSAGNIDHDDRVSIIAMDYPNRRRLKLYGHAIFDPEPDTALLERLGATGRSEGVLTVEVVSFNWNCPKYITPRYTEEQVAAAVAPLRERIHALEAELAALRR